MLFGPGLRVWIGPFVVQVRTNIPELIEILRHAYAAYPIADDEIIADLHVEVRTPLGIRRWIKSQAEFRLDEEAPFEPMPRKLAFPLLEWGINWGIAMRSHQYLMLHSAVVARGEHALIMPGLPGNGKTTLCSALVNSGLAAFVRRVRAGRYSTRRHCACAASDAT